MNSTGSAAISDVEVLCQDVYLGRLSRRLHVSLSLSLIHRHTQDWGGKVYFHPGGVRTAFRGPFRELAIERILRKAPGREPYRFAPGWFLDSAVVDKLRAAEGIDPSMLHQLSTWSLEYHRNLTTVESGQSVVNEITILPGAVEKSLRVLAAHLAATQ